MPGLRKAPLFGALFRSRRKERAESEILLILRPCIVGNTQNPVFTVSEVRSGIESAMEEEL